MPHKLTDLRHSLPSDPDDSDQPAAWYWVWFGALCHTPDSGELRVTELSQHRCPVDNPPPL